MASLLYLLYLATQMSAVCDPIKIYKLGLTQDEVYAQLTQISEVAPNLEIVFFDTIGTEKEGRDYHCDMTLTDASGQYAFHFIYKRNDDDDQLAQLTTHQR